MATALVAAVATSVADAKPRLKPLVEGPASAGVMSDGFVGVTSPNQPFRLIDEATGRVSSFALPRGCHGTFGLRVPRLLVSCSDGPRLLNIETGDLQAVPSPSYWPYSGCEGDPGFVDLGLHWIVGYCGGHNVTSIQFFIDWRTGSFRRGNVSELDEEPPPTPLYYDIDSPDLAISETVRCSGVPDTFRKRPKWLVYRTGDSSKLVLRRCRGGRRIFLARNDATGVARGRAAAWAAGTKIGLYMIDTGRRYRWNAPRTAYTGGGELHVSLSDRYLYVHVPATDGYHRVYRAALPRRATAARSSSR